MGELGSLESRYGGELQAAEPASTHALLAQKKTLIQRGPLGHSLRGTVSEPPIAAPDQGKSTPYSLGAEYPQGGKTELLVFGKGTTGQTVVLPNGTIPGHGSDGALHVAFAIDKDELDRWEAHLASRGVTIEGRKGTRRPQHLFPRSRRASFRTRNAGIVAGVLGAASRRLREAPHDLIHRGSQA